MRGEWWEEKGGEGMEGGEGRGEEAFLVMWPRRLSALNPPLLPRHSYGVVSGNGFFGDYDHFQPPDH